jgi:sugar phosphate permease
MKHKRPVVYYGWWIVTASFLISVYTAGVVYFSFTAVFEPIAEEFGWSYTQISLAASLRGLETGLLAPLVGYLTDRWGPRRLVFGGVVATGAGLMLLSRVTSLPMFYGAFVLIAIGISTCIGTILLTAVVYWFKKNLAIATGIMACGTAIGGFMIAPVTILIDTFGWRFSMAILGVGMWVIGIPLSLLIRHKPEHYGYLPDGITEDEQKVNMVRNPTQNTEQDMDARQAIHSRTFWHIALALTYQSLVLTTYYALSQHNGYFQDIF